MSDTTTGRDTVTRAEPPTLHGIRVVEPEDYGDPHRSRKRCSCTCGEVFFLPSQLEVGALTHGRLAHIEDWERRHTTGQPHLGCRTHSPRRNGEVNA